MRGSRLKIELTSYQGELRRRGVSTAYIYSVKGIVNRFVRELERQETGCCRKVTSEQVNSFLAEHVRFSASYQRTIINAVRGFLMFNGNMCMLRTKYRVYGSPPTRREFLNRDKWLVLMDTPMNWNEALITMGARLEGMRGSELLRFRASDAREALRSMEIPIRGKMRPETVPLRPQFEHLLKGYLEANPRKDEDLMLGFARTKLDRTLAALSTRVGFPVRLKDMRRGYGRDFHDAGESLEMTAELMRHTNPAMTKHYLCLDRDAKQKAMDRVTYPERSGIPVLLAK
jgi:integrase